jgi:catechol 2,3-dioxygenase-like lactoylglutathione lyase family enzyme
MRIQELILVTPQLATQKAFYGTTLGWPVVTDRPTSFTVQAGATRLSFKQASPTGIYHVAFAIPHNAAGQAKAWLQQRVTLLHKDGADEFSFANLNAHSFYFSDADSNILEFIMQDEVACDLQDGFGSASVLHVAEIGLPSEDVPALAAMLRQHLDLEPYGGPIAEDFAFMGDRAGYVVLVKTGRLWFPTRTLPATVAPVHMVLVGRLERQVDLAPYPYTIAVTCSDE